MNGVHRMTCPTCRSALTETAEFCPNCLGSVTSSSVPLAAVLAPSDPAGAPREPVAPASPLAEADEPVGIGGWLVFPAIGLVFNLIGLTVMVLGELLPILTGPQWEFLTTEGSEAYHPMWGPVILFELVGNSLLILASGVIATLFFLRKSAVPRLMVGFFLFRILIIAIDEVLAGQLPAESIEGQGIGELVKVVVQACIWIPYFLVSKRVRNTFVR